MFRTLMPVALLIAPFAAQAQETPASAAPAPVAQDAAISSKPPQRIRDITLTGTEACPKPVGDEVVVCHKLDEPYRLPKAFRQPPVPPVNQAWTRKVETMDEVGRRNGGLPDTCSVVGTGGATGCTAQMIQEWSREQRAKQAANAATGEP